MEESVVIFLEGGNRLIPLRDFPAYRQENDVRLVEITDVPLPLRLHQVLYRIQVISEEGVSRSHAYNMAYLLDLYSVERTNQQVTDLTWLYYSGKGLLHSRSNIIFYAVFPHLPDERVLRSIVERWVNDPGGLREYIRTTAPIVAIRHLPGVHQLDLDAKSYPHRERTKEQ